MHVTANYRHGARGGIVGEGSNRKTQPGLKMQMPSCKNCLIGRLLPIITAIIRYSIKGGGICLTEIMDVQVE